MQVAKSSTIPSENDVIDFCCRRDFIYKPRIVATFFFQPRAAFELFYSTFSSGFLFRKTKARKTARLKISISRPLMSWFARSRKIEISLIFRNFWRNRRLFAEIAVFAGHPCTS